MFTKILLVFQIIAEVSKLLFGQINYELKALIQSYTYRASPICKNVVVIGGSYAGVTCSQYLARNLPSGWRVVLVEKNSHFHHTWLFPRVSVIDRNNDLAFIPYPDKLARTIDGSWKRVKARAVRFYDDHISLDDGQDLPFVYLVVAMGLPGRYPVGIDEMQRSESLQRFDRSRAKLQDSQRVVIIGGGPVGIEIALDIKSEYSGKYVTLVHSRPYLAHKYDKIVHDECLKMLHSKDVEVIFNERARIHGEDSIHIELSSGRTLPNDMAIVCTGVSSIENTSPFLPTCTDYQSGMIKVNQYLQVADPKLPHVYAIGDIANTGTMKTGRAAGLQGMLASSNILRHIEGKSLKAYQPGFIENFLDLTLGLSQHLVHIGGNHGASLQFVSRARDETLGAHRLWKLLGSKPPKAYGASGQLAG